MFFRKVENSPDFIFASRRTLLSVVSEKAVEKMEQDVDDDEEETVTQVKSEFS